MFTEIDGRSLRTAEEERLEREKELKKTEFQRKKSFFESESATDHSSTPTDNKSGMYMYRGQGTGGVWGGPTLPRIRDLYSKNFENSQNIFFS